MSGWILAVALAAFLQGAGKLCPDCKSSGRTSCPEHPARECSLEDEVLFCSVVADCAACGGVGFVPCERCDDAAARATIEKRRKAIQARKGILREIDDQAGRPLRKAETEHVVFTWEMDEYKIGKRVVSAHEALHVYAARMEAAFGEYCATLEVDPKFLGHKCWLFVWALPKDQEEAAGTFCGARTPHGVTLLGETPRFTTCGAKQEFRGDDELHRNLRHQLSHLLLSHQMPMGWLGERRSAWADEGLAHWLEFRVGERCETYCHHETREKLDFEGGKYRIGVRKLVAKDSAPPMADVMQKNAPELTAAENAVSFSYVDYLLTLGGTKLDALLKELKNRKPVRDLIPQIYGTSLLELEARWKAWVLETYPTK